jgi:hypothetical protein
MLALRTVLHTTWSPFSIRWATRPTPLTYDKVG